MSDLDVSGKQGSRWKRLDHIYRLVSGKEEWAVIVPGEKREKILRVLIAYHIVRPQ